MIKRITDRTIRFTYKPIGRYNLYGYLILGDNNSYIIDTGCGENDVKLIHDYLEINNINKPVIIINTHYHWDHIWGNGFIKSKMIVAHHNCYNMIVTNWDEMLNSNQRFINGKVSRCLPNITFNDELVFKEDEIELFYSTGHTIDGICIYDRKDRMLYVGDNIGDDDLQIVPDLVSTKLEYLNSLRKMQEYDIRYILSGHNEIKERDFIDKIIDKVKEQ